MADQIEAESLKQQFASLQEQQQKKLQLRKQKQEEKKKAAATSAKTAAVKGKSKSASVSSSSSFGVDDDLNLKLADPPAPTNSIYSEELVLHLNDQIRELKDETGRLYKLLSERDLELRQLRKKREDDKLLQGTVSSDSAATKIVELSKKIRQMNTDLESEKTKNKQLQKKCFDLEVELQNAGDGGRKTTSLPNSARGEMDKDPQHEIKTLNEKLRQAEMKVSEFRNQSTTLRNEIKMAQKVIEQEVGEGASIQSCMGAGAGGWRGRAQQIIALQKKVNELRSSERRDLTADADLESELSLAGTTRSSRGGAGADERQRAEIRRLERERKQQQEKSAAELKALEGDYESLKGKLDSSKARNKVLSNEVKTLKQQIETLLEKGRHDDELVTALFKQQSQLKTTLADRNRQKEEVESSKQQSQLKSALAERGRQEEEDAAARESARRHAAMRDQQESNIVTQLKAIVAEREAKVHTLEQEIEQLQEQNLQAAHMNGVSQMFEPAGRPKSMAREGSSLLIEDFGTMTPHPQSRAESRQSDDRPPSHRAASQQTSARHGSASSRPGSAANNQHVQELSVQLQEQKSLCQVATVERDKLKEFVQVLQTRIDDATNKATQAQTELVAIKRKNVQLEKQLGKAKMEQNMSASSSKRMTGSRVSLSTNLDDHTLSADDALEEMETNLLIQKDENEALKVALQSTLEAKEADLKLYNDMMDETKTIFLQGLRQYRDKVS